MEEKERLTPAKKKVKLGMKLIVWQVKLPL